MSQDGMNCKQQVFLRSYNDHVKCFVSFVNKTPHTVVLYWINYEGHAVSYGEIKPDQMLDVNTYVTHPWIFVDKETNERYTVNQEDVFYPKPQGENRNERQRASPLFPLNSMTAIITLPLYTLRDLSLRVIRRHLTDDWQAFQLDIPRNLQYMLARMLLGTENSDD